MSLGLKRGTVQLEPHDKQWEEVAVQTIKTLKSILGDDAIDIQHIGSTAIPAIKSKPIIDIAVGVTDFDRIMSHNEQLQQEGIFYRGSDVEHQLLYVMGDMENDTRTHHIHILKWNGTEWKNYIHFRDYLNANENVALQYQKLKEELESKYADDRGAYTRQKQNMINSILNRGIIREAIIDDLDEILHLYLYLHEKSVPEESELLRSTWESIINDNNHHLIVCEVDGKIVASCVCVIIPNLTRNVRPYAFVENVVTHADYRKKGYATDCLNYAKKIAEKCNCYKMMLLTGSKEESTLNFYRNAGYNSTDKTAFTQWLDM